MAMSKVKLIVIILIVAVVGFIGFRITGGAIVGPGEYDDFAVCLTDSGAKMYGAYWCSHCQDQKKAFGNSWKKVNYIECSLPGGRAVAPECSAAGVSGYPTWEFGDSTRVSGFVPLRELSLRTGCALP